MRQVKTLLHRRQSLIRGFTLIELILVAGIFGLFALGIMAVANPSQQVLKANDARRKADLAQIQRGLEAYYQDNGRYPASQNNKIYTTAPLNWGSSWQPYMNILPKDPSSSRVYVYYATSDGQSYILYASLERGAKDPQACNNGDPCSSLSMYGIAPTACGGTCNYAVASADINP